MEIPYLRVPVFREGAEVRYAHTEQHTEDDLERRLLDLVFEGGASLDDLAGELVHAGRCATLPEARTRLKEAFADPHNAIGLIDVPVDPDYDVILVEQGYAGVYVHTTELAKELQKRWKVLLLAPGRPLFDEHGVQHVVSLQDLRERAPDVPYFSYVHVLRSIVRRVTTRLLLITHRSQTFYLFDLIARQPTIIYCDGFFDGGFRTAVDLGLPGRKSATQRILSEIYFLVGNGHPDFHGLAATPSCNQYLLMAGYRALRDARENWCWGQKQAENFERAFSRHRRPIRFMPPFTQPDLFQPDLVQRDLVVLFTTTMHNIERKGFPELVRAMKRLPDVRVRCVVRQPHRLPPYPEGVAARLDIGAVTKPEMVELYHRVWVNCRVSREESSPVSILEGMICEVPQIVSPAVAEQIPLIEDGKTGFVVDPDDGPGLVRALRRVLADRELRDELGEEARRRAVEYAFDRRVGAFERYLA